ncbi:MAG: NAD(P)-binding domain-containing protein [Planctomycetota bacterium]
MSWLFLLGVTLALGLSFVAAASRRAELARMEESVRVRERARKAGADKAQLQHPVIDLSRCLGCATCVAACPEDGVLELVHGQAMVVRGARCQGISACERECPVGAITITLADIGTRRDVPAITEELEAAGEPGLFLAGEVTAHALIKTAVEHGVSVGSEVARRAAANRVKDDAELDLVIVGAGPAGLACALESKRNGLSFALLEQESGPGGTVAKYPRRKLVVTQPIELPLVGKLKRTSYSKEELVELWQQVTDEHQLPLKSDSRFEALERIDDGGFVVHTSQGELRARHVCLALGRRGTPNKLGVPGEELSKVAYSLLDAASFSGRRVLVVGGGNSAVEAALGLAEQAGNIVTLSYRRSGFFRISGANEARLNAALEAGRLQVLYSSRVQAIREDAVELAVGEGAETESVELPNDDVFVLAGGTAPFEVLERAGVSFDPSLREQPKPVGEQGTGLMRALGIGFAVSSIALVWALWHMEYYGLPQEQRPAHAKHEFLRPGEGAGLWLGVAATGLIAANLFYLVRRSPRIRFAFGSLKLWMTSHVATGILAFLCATLHAAMSPGNSVGGHAYWAMAVLLVTGAIGRYFYAYVPREANGRELELDEVKKRLARLAEEWDQGQQRFRERARDSVEKLVESQRWQRSFFGRVRALVRGQRELGRVLRSIRRTGKTEGVAPFQVKETVRLARRAHHTAMMAAHYEDLRAVAGSWRYFHRWISLLMVVLVAVHVAYALIYGGRLGGLG